MGGSTSSNIIDNSVAAMVSVLSNVSQGCKPSADHSQQITVIQKNCGGGSNVHIHDVDMSSVISVKTSCLQEAAGNQNAQQQISQVAQQMAKSVTQALSLNPLGSKAQNIMRMSMNVGTAVQSSVSQVIAAATSANQQILVKQMGGGPCTADIGMISMKTYTSNVAEAVQKSTTIQTAVTALKQEADQKATAIQKGLLAGLAIILFVVLALVVGGVGLFGTKGLKALVPGARAARP